MKISLFFLSFNLAITSSFVHAEEKTGLPRIVHDPFQKPKLTKTFIKPKSITQSIKPAASWTPHLISTLRAGDHSMANVGGKIIAVGEEINGYKLIKVSERAVVFVNQGKTTRLTLDDEE